MSDELVEYLLDEIRELMRAGSVGLHEFPESLTYGHAGLPWGEQIRVSRAALSIILESGEAHLVWEVWAKQELTRDASGEAVPDSAWEMLSEDPDDLHKPFLAIVPNDVERRRRGRWSRRNSK